MKSIVWFCVVTSHNLAKLCHTRFFFLKHQEGQSIIYLWLEFWYFLDEGWPFGWVAVLRKRKDSPQVPWTLGSHNCWLQRLSHPGFNILLFWMLLLFHQMICLFGAITLISSMFWSKSPGCPWPDQSQLSSLASWTRPWKSVRLIDQIRFFYLNIVSSEKFKSKMSSCQLFQIRFFLTWGTQQAK